MAKNKIPNTQYSKFEGLDKDGVRDTSFILRRDSLTPKDLDKTITGLLPEKILTGVYLQARFTYPEKASIEYNKDTAVGWEMLNSSGGTRAKGDVVIVDTSNDISFTTTTSANSALVIGVVAEIIHNGKRGLVQFSGIAEINCNATAVARGNFLRTSTTAAQAELSATGENNVIAVALTTKGAGTSGLVYGKIITNVDVP